MIAEISSFVSSVKTACDIVKGISTLSPMLIEMKAFPKFLRYSSPYRRRHFR